MSYQLPLFKRAECRMTPNWMPNGECLGHACMMMRPPVGEAKNATVVLGTGSRPAVQNTARKSS